MASGLCILQTNLGGIASAVDAAMVDAALERPPLGTPRATPRPLWACAAEGGLGNVEGESGLPRAAPTAWPRTL